MDVVWKVLSLNFLTFKQYTATLIYSNKYCSNTGIKVKMRQEFLLAGLLPNWRTPTPPFRGLCMKLLWFVRVFLIRHCQWINFAFF
jgi:hypothetical protein